MQVEYEKLRGGLQDFELNNTFDFFHQLNYGLLEGCYYFSLTKIDIPISVNFFTDEEAIDSRILQNVNKICLKYNSFAERRIENLKNIFDKLNENIRGIFELNEPYKLIEDVDKLSLKSLLSSSDNLEVENLITVIKLLLLNMSIAEFDENLTCDDDTLNKLEIFVDVLRKSIITKDNATYIDSPATNKEKNENIAAILEDKLSFLKQKIKIRQFIAENKEFDYKSYNHLCIIGDNNSFNLFFENVKNHYLLAKIPYTQKPTEFISNIECLKKYTDDTGKVGNIKIEEILNYSRHLRKRLNEESIPYESAIEEVKSVIGIIRKTTIPSSDFENFALKSANNLLFNTLIRLQLKFEISKNYESCILELSNSKINELTFIRNILNQIKDSQEDTKVEDYYPYLYCIKFLQGLISSIREDVLRSFGIDRVLLDEKNELDYIKKAEQKLQIIDVFYTETIKLFRSKFKWAKKRKWNPIYLGESASKINNDKFGDLSLFLDSSYILPDNFAKIEESFYAEEQYKQTNLRSTKNRVQFEIHRVVTENSVDKKKDEFEKKVKENEFKQVQIIAMFISIATFVLGNVRIFENKSLNGGLSVMLAFASCLLLFNAFFKWLIRDSLLVSLDENKQKDDGWITLTKLKVSFTDLILVVIIFSFAGLSVFFNYKDDESLNSELMRKITPLIEKKNKQILDSLSKVVYIDTTQKARFEVMTKMEIQRMVKDSSLKIDVVLKK